MLKPSCSLQSVNRLFFCNFDVFSDFAALVETSYYSPVESPDAEINGILIESV
jgi:hypothetical protein